MSNTDPTKNTTQKTKKMINMDPHQKTQHNTENKKDEQHGPPPKNWANSVAHEEQTAPTSYKTPATNTCLTPL
jgi:hypothetical protein